MEKEKFSLVKRLRSFRYAGRGVSLLLRGEHNAWIHLLAACCVIVAGVWLGLSAGEWIAVVACIGGVFAAEAFNSALERLCDKVSPGYDDTIKQVKDLSAGAVLLVAIAAAVTGLIIFIPKVLISTLGSEGIKRVEQMWLPELERLSYIVAWQGSDACEVPEALLQRKDVKVLRNPGLGLSQNRNFAFQNSSADLLIIADDDLKYSKESLQAVREVFDAEKNLDIALFRYENEKGGYEKIYPPEVTNLTHPYPKNYYISSVEIVIRRKGRAEGLRFCEQIGLGAPVLKCGEEELFIHQAFKNDCVIKLFPINLCVHCGPTTGKREVKDVGIYRGMGAMASLQYPLTFPLRFFIIALRGRRSGKMKFIPALRNFFYGAYFIRRHIIRTKTKE